MTEANCFVGLMSGTSLDGVDAVCCRFAPSFTLLGHVYLPMPTDLRNALLALQSPQADEIHLAQLSARQLADWYGEAITALLAKTRIERTHISALGCHGQTIRHRPAEGYTLQLNQPARLAEICGIDVICDFRSRDIAAGGQGAPLVPAFHQALFASAATHRAVVNIGGMSNVTDLPLSVQTIGFDCGPGNVLMDAWIQRIHQRPYDEHGKWAAQGRVIPDLLASWLQHSFFALIPPKSCGREEFGDAWLNNPALARHRPEDVQATLLELTARCIADSIQEHCKQAREVYVCGGGANNAHLMTRIGQLLGPERQLASTAALGLPVDAVEACAFAWLANAFCERNPGNLPAVTGARGPRILGALYPA